MPNALTVRLLVLCSASLLLARCMPYSVGSTARPLQKGVKSYSFTALVLPNAQNLSRTDNYPHRPAGDMEMRVGVSDRADMGLRIPSLDGLIYTYKRRLDGPSYKQGPAVAIMVGGGMLNFFSHAELESTIIATADESGRFTPYGGLRTMYATPFYESETRKSKLTYGGFVGTRIGSSELGISAEVGVFHDPGVFEFYKNNTVIVPSITVNGNLLERLSDLMNRSRR